MLSEDTLERLSERLVDRIESLNAYFINKIGNQIKTIGTITPSQLAELLQSVQYGNDIEEIMNKISEVTDMNVKDIYDIFEEVAKKNQSYAKKFYEYQKVKFIPYEQNKILQEQVKSIAKSTAEEYINMSKTFAYMSSNENGMKEYTLLSDIYQKITDEAILSIVQGRESYEMIMKKMMKEMTSNGLRTVDYASGYSRRADSSVRMNMMDGIRRLHREQQEEFGKEFGANGIEVSHHKYAAPDHIDTIDGRQFSTKGETIIDGIKYEDYETVNSNLDRHVGELNCYHFPFQIVLGVSKPIYSKEQLEADKQANMKGFDFEGNHYTMYEGTQLQRQIETKIRKYKDRQIGAKSINDMDEVYHCQEKISQLTNKYKELSDVSGLPTKVDRLRVDGYRQIVSKKYTNLFEDNILERDFKNLNNDVEHMIIYDANSGNKILQFTSNNKNSVGNLKAYTMILTSKKNSLSIAHNHPSNSSFSFRDIETFNKYKSIDSIIVKTDDYLYYLQKNGINKVKPEDLKKLSNIARSKFYKQYGRNPDSSHMVNEEISKKVGWDYGRVERIRNDI